jgi:hypothetical protein
VLFTHGLAVAAFPGWIGIAVWAWTSSVAEGAMIAAFPVAKLEKGLVNLNAWYEDGQSEKWSSKRENLKSS